jgi:putative ABC transport system permease protein
MDHPFRVSGIVEQGKGGRKLIPLETMQNLSGAGDMASLFYIKCDNPANDDLVIAGDSRHARLRQQHADHGGQLAQPDDAEHKFPGFNLALEVITVSPSSSGFW